MPPNASSVPATCRARSFSAPSSASTSSVNSGPLVSTSADENAVERSMPHETMPTCTVCPMSPQATKRGQSSRRGSAALALRRNAMASSRKPSAGMTRKRRNRNAPTPMVLSTCLVTVKLIPHTTMIAIAAISDRRAARAEVMRRARRH